MNNVTFFSDARAFVDRTLPDLSRDETRNNLILGLALRLKEDPHAYTEQDPLMAVVSDESGKNLAMAIMTPPFPMIIQSEPLHLEALETLADALLKNGWYLPGVNGVSEVSDSFAQIWESKTEQNVRLLMSLRAYELRKIAELEYPSGGMRIAEEKDAQKVAEMHNAMRQELVAQPGNAATVESALKTIRQQRTFFWVVDGEVVSITNAVRPQIKGICISGVYTPPEFRRKGYARALVAEVSKEMLSRGFELTNLFTDLANPTSNKIYQEVGYKAVCDYCQYSFG
ncbi:MAG: GNAT family N-acetyltransferase [Anaerolineaceae bacterium]|jgi:predicted GNAT family acetyltransferase|nr:GNAT family N-acetyltransferase [Anaerolineaceae bacterium]